MNSISNKITPKMIADNIKSQIITLAKALEVEKACSIDTSIDLTRNFLISQHNELLSEEWKGKIEDIRERVASEIASGNASDLARKVYALLAYLHFTKAT